MIARALQAAEPEAAVLIMTGVPFRPAFLDAPGVEVVAMPPLLKDRDGAYRPTQMSFEAAVARREAMFLETLERFDPDVVVVDRHPFGTAGELRAGIERFKHRGGAAVLGLRDVLDEPAVVRTELAGRGWDGVPELFDEVIVYGGRSFCDHELEYELPVAPVYCGWVTDAVAPKRREDRLLAIAAGGGGDGASVLRIALGVIELRADWSGVLAAGPYADAMGFRERVAESNAKDRFRVVSDVAGCASLFATAAGVLQMAGYNSTFEALATGQRSILVPRRTPRREQAIRAQRLATLGLADVVDETAVAEEVSWLLDRPRQLSTAQVDQAGINFEGAAHAAHRLRALAGVRSQ